ncbi:hypothetical protein MTR_2g007270 [Medicago truncatula]|uniref:Uncharacterized protein n=1 Tax=Medicago truncatula TaxID=3880 RepID=G7IJW5_MEDTR|nr:hypothetical protein MTR_2g007270 [Medicago truncatula]
MTLNALFDDFPPFPRTLNGVIVSQAFGRLQCLFCDAQGDEAVNVTLDFENVNTSDFENVNIGDEVVKDNDEPNLGMDCSEAAVVRVKTLHISSPIFIFIINSSHIRFISYC